MSINYRALLFTLLFGLSQVAQADVNSIENLKSLFTTPKERSILNDFRASGKFSNKRNKNTSSLVKLKVNKVKFHGIMIREKGKPVVWVNNGNTLISEVIDSDITVNTRHITKHQVAIPVRVNQKILTMKPGQQWNESDNRIRDKYQIK